MHKQTTAGTIQILENFVAGGCGSQGRHVIEDSQKISESRRANGRQT